MDYAACSATPPRSLRLDLVLVDQEPPRPMMGLLDSEAGKRRLLTVEIPVIERYNEGRDPAFKIRVTRQGGSLVLRYQLKPAHNIYVLETRLVSSYPAVPPEIRVVTPLKHCPHL